MGPQLGLRKLSDTCDLGVKIDGGAETKKGSTESNHVEVGSVETKMEAAAGPSQNNTSLNGLKEEESLLNEKTEHDDISVDLGTVLKGSPFEPQEGFGNNLMPEVIATNNPQEPEDLKGEDTVPSNIAEAPSKQPAPKGQQPASGKAKPTVTSVTARPAAASKPSPNLSLRKTADIKKSASKKDSETSKSVGKTSQVQKPLPTSPSASKKPASKPPTRPVNLPAAATALTAASAAKLPGLASSRSPSRASTNGTSNDRKVTPAIKRDRLSIQTKGPSSATTTALQKRTPKTAPHTQRPPTAIKPGLQKKTSRASLPPDEGFLARMMRPTASSASKVHEKVETKSPPRKLPSTKPKRRSDGSEGKSRLAEDETLKIADDMPQTQSETVANGADHAGSAPGT